MKRSLALFAACALVPAMVGPLEAEARHLTVALCGGGFASMPIDGPRIPGGPQAPCCAKGCHSERERKRIDRTQ